MARSEPSNTRCHMLGAMQNKEIMKFLGRALNAVVGINKSYIEVKGRTFYANNLFADNPLASDDLINDTLEHMRQNLQERDRSPG